MSVKIIANYNVGTNEVKILKGPKGYQYIVNKEYGNNFVNEVRKAAETSIIGQLSGSSLYKTIKSATMLLKRKGLRVLESDVAYALRESLKYRKLQVLIDDPYIEDISVVGTGPIWVRHSIVIKEDPLADYIQTNIIIESELELLQHISILSERSGRAISKLNPIIDANLPEEDGSHRIHLVLPEITGGKGEIVIRKKKPYRFVSLRELQKEGMIEEPVVSLIKKVIHEKGSLLIVGPPGSGKTTLLRAILYSLVPPSWKVAIIEDTPEIDLPPGSSWVKYVVPLTSSKEVTLDQLTLTKAALRSSVSKFLVVGETRGKEARVLVQAMNMGLGGLTTFHGGSPEEAIRRLTSHPIDLTQEQLGMFKLIITLGFIESGKGIKRSVIDVSMPYLDGNLLKLKRLYQRKTGKITEEKLIEVLTEKPALNL